MRAAGGGLRPVRSPNDAAVQAPTSTDAGMVAITVTTTNERTENRVLAIESPGRSRDLLGAGISIGSLQNGQLPVLPASSFPKIATRWHSSHSTSTQANLDLPHSGQISPRSV